MHPSADPSLPGLVLDATDLRILGLLARNGRRTNKELAAEVRLAPSSCHARLQRLFGGGVITGVHASISLRHLGLGLQAMVSVRLAQPAKRQDDLLQRILGRPEVLQLYRVAGSQDLLLHVAVEEADHLRVLLEEDLFSAPEVRHAQASVIFEHRRSPGPPFRAG